MEVKSTGATLFFSFVICCASIFATVEDQLFVIPIAFPMFKQCNSSWGDHIIENMTICEVGCLLSSISMGLRHYMIKINNKEVDPGTLNTWLRENGGYLSNDELVEVSLEKIPGVHYKGSFKSIAYQDIVDNLLDGILTIAHVRNGTHFVLITGYTALPSNRWAVNDPGFNQTSYCTSDIVGFRIFEIK